MGEGGELLQGWCALSNTQASDTRIQENTVAFPKPGNMTGCQFGRESQGFNLRFTVFWMYAGHGYRFF